MDPTLKDMVPINEKSKESARLLSHLRSAAINSSQTKLPAKTREELVTAREVLFKNPPETPSKKREYHPLYQQTAAIGSPPKRKRENAVRSNSEQRPYMTDSANSQESTSHILNKSCSSTELLESNTDYSRKLPLEHFTQGESLLDGSASFSTEVHKPVPETSDESVVELNCYLSKKNENSNARVHGNAPSRTTKSTSPIEVSDDSPGSMSLIEVSSDSTNSSQTSTHSEDDTDKRYPIPVAERFQASIPEWTGPPAYDYYLDSSRWLGEMTWPIEGRNTNPTNMLLIGRGRPDFLCTCQNPDSSDCLKRHIQEAAARLQAEIGDAFYTWGFDRMGEVVCESWTLKMQRDFNSLFRRKTGLSKGSFWKRAFKLFPLTPTKSIVRYYFDVFVLRNVRKQANLQFPEIDSDDDVVGDSPRKSKTPRRRWLR